MQDTGVPFTGENLDALFKNNTSIWGDFFGRLESLEVLALDYINLIGWILDVLYSVAGLNPVEKSLLYELQFGGSVAKFSGQDFFSIKLETL
jgi:hypothetical protein